MYYSSIKESGVTRLCLLLVRTSLISGCSVARSSSRVRTSSARTAEPHSRYSFTASFKWYLHRHQQGESSNKRREANCIKHSNWVTHRASFIKSQRKYRFPSRSWPRPHSCSTPCRPASKIASLYSLTASAKPIFLLAALSARSNGA